MSGSRQHFIPRFLQEGFASHATSKGVFTWAYRSDRVPYNSNIINVGVEGQFYTQGEDRVVDDTITETEGALGKIVTELRTMEPGEVVSARVANLIAHLEIRTRHLRENFIRAGNRLLDGLLDFMAREDEFVTYLDRKLREDPTIVRKAFEEKFQELGMPANLLEPVLQQSWPLMADMMELNKSWFPLIAAQLKIDMPRMIKDSAKIGHIRALKKSLSPTFRKEHYETLSFRVVELPTAELILGDAPIIFQAAGGKLFKTFFEKGDQLTAIYLPLTPRRILIGSSLDEPNLPEDFTRITAQCSLEYFIANENAEKYQRLQSEIGLFAAPLTNAEIDAILSDLIQPPSS